MCIKCRNEDDTNGKANATQKKKRKIDLLHLQVKCKEQNKKKWRKRLKMNREWNFMIYLNALMTKWNIKIIISFKAFLFVRKPYFNS